MKMTKSEGLYLFFPLYFCCLNFDSNIYWMIICCLVCTETCMSILILIFFQLIIIFIRIYLWNWCFYVCLLFLWLKAIIISLEVVEKPYSWEKQHKQNEVACTIKIGQYKPSRLWLHPKVGTLWRANVSIQALLSKDISTNHLYT